MRTHAAGKVPHSIPEELLGFPPPEAVSKTWQVHFPDERTRRTLHASLTTVLGSRAGNRTEAMESPTPQCLLLLFL